MIKMGIKMTNFTKPILTFEFASSTGEIKPLTFQNPIEIIIAKTTDEVLGCLNKVEEAVQKGYYAAGFLTYESAKAFDPSFKVKENYEMPLLWFGIFTEPLNEQIKSENDFALMEWRPSISVEQYNHAIKQIKQNIMQGNTYQTNYTIRLHSTFQGDSIAYYERLKKAQDANYCAYIDIGDFKVLSVSPELFFHVKDRNITTRPMKGTMKRGTTLKEDKEKMKELYHSEKNRAENVMIVDLLRNDIGMIAQSGSVQVEQLFHVETYPTVHQMTSTITGTLRENTKITDIFKSLFPCGSITGAPKIKTMEIIEQLENEPREVYCGAIGYITPENEAIFNVPIRTVVINEKTKQATYGVGGGVTWDSDAQDEYYEIVAKAKVLEEKRPPFHLLESILLSNGQYFLLDKHLKRLENSSKYFKYKVNVNEIKKSLKQYAKDYPNGDYKIRLLLQKDGNFSIEGHKISKIQGSLKVTLADEPVTSSDVFLYHKTTNREVYTKFQKRFSDVFDVLLWNERRELTEFTNGNIVLEMDNKLVTPKVECGLLAGTYRDSLLEEGKIEEKIVTVDDLEKCQNIWFINSVRKWIKVELT